MVSEGIAERNKARNESRARFTFNEGKKDMLKPESIWGRGRDADPHISIRTPRNRRNRYQQSRNDRLKIALYTPDKEIRGKARTERQWFNDPRDVFIG